MRLCSSESLVDAPSCCGASRPAFGAALLLMVPIAQGPQIVVPMVIAGANVVYIGRQLGAADAFVAPGAAVAVPDEDAAANGCPVVGEALAPVAASPLGHVAPSLR